MTSVLSAQAQQNRSAQCSFFQGARALSITFRHRSVYIFKLILSVCKAIKTVSKLFKSNNSLTFDINLL
jgi:hypothetical protein